MSEVGRGFAAADTAALWRAHDYMMQGLDRVAEPLEDGSFNTVGPKGEAPPSQSGQLTLGLLVRCDEELAYRIDRGEA